MSTYTLKAKHKKTGVVKEFLAIDDYYGKHQYGYRDDEGTTYNEEGFDIIFERVKETTPKEEELIKKFHEEFGNVFEYEEEHTKFWLKIRREAIAEERKRIEKGIKEVYQNAKEDHICRFNDGECKCECYYTAINDVISHLTQE